LTNWQFKQSNSPNVKITPEVLFLLMSNRCNEKQTMYQKKQKAKICTQTIQNGVTTKCSIYHKYKKQIIIKIKKRNRHQHNIDDGRQAVGEEMRHVQMSR